MKVTKNISRGGQIKDMTVIYSLAIKKQSIVVAMGGTHFVRPAAFIMNWTLFQLMRTKIYYAVKDKNIKDADYQ